LVLVEGWSEALAARQLTVETRLPRHSPQPGSGLNGGLLRKRAPRPCLPRLRGSASCCSRPPKLVPGWLAVLLTPQAVEQRAGR
jgi:hypothetical protein